MTNLSENSTQISSNWENDKVNTGDGEQSVAEKEAFKNRQHGGYQRQSQGTSRHVFPSHLSIHILTLEARLTIAIIHGKCIYLMTLEVLCRRPGGGPRLNRRARIQFGPVHFGEKPWKTNLEPIKPGKTNLEPRKPWKPTWNHGKPWKTTWNHEKQWKTAWNHENQPGESAHFSLVTQGHNWPSWHRMRKCSFFVTHVGSKLTYMTQNEKVLIFCYWRGVTTDLLDV